LKPAFLAGEKGFAGFFCHPGRLLQLHFKFHGITN
jgi:hypothetical protein